MRYKTTIEIVTEASNKHEAAEIAGEYLSGDIVSGVKMKCASRPVPSYNGKVVASVAVSLAIIIVGLVVTLQTKTPGMMGRSSASFDAVQPPLKTSVVVEKDSNFKKEWQEKKTKEILNFIKK